MSGLLIQEAPVPTMWHIVCIEARDVLLEHSAGVGCIRHDVMWLL